MKPTTIIILVVMILTGCAAQDVKPVHTLASKESMALGKLSERLKSNRKAMQETTDNLGHLGAEWTEKEFELVRALANAKRLESMNSPWLTTRTDFVQGQRAVILHHLYEVEMAQQKVLQARMAQRRVAAQEIFRSYDQMARLVAKAASNLEIVEQDLNQSKSAQLRAFAATFLGEVTAFREQLQTSKNPRVLALAEDVARHESSLVKFKEQADNALQAFLSTKNGG